MSEHGGAGVSLAIQHKAPPKCTTHHHYARLLHISEEPSTVYGFAQRANDLDRICNRASLFDRVRSRVGTREC